MLTTIFSSWNRGGSYFTEFLQFLAKSQEHACTCLLLLQSCPTLRPHGLYVAHQAPLSIATLQARILEWVAVPSSRRSSQLRDRTHLSMSPALAGGFFTTSATWEAPCCRAPST